MEKQLTVQKQKYNINSKTKKNSKGSHPGPLTSPSNPFGPTKSKIIDLTTVNSQSMGRKQHSTQTHTTKRRNVQRDNSQTQVMQYNPASMPL
jgi:hypothetical protein